LIIQVKVTPKSQKPRVVKLDDGSYKVYVRSVPEDGKANEEAQKLLAQYLNTGVQSIQLIQGFTHRNKVFSIH
jgi:uncharacterized protein